MNQRASEVGAGSAPGLACETGCATSASRVLPWMPLAFVGVLTALLLFVPKVRQDEGLATAFGVAAGALALWTVALVVRSRVRGVPLRVEFAPPQRVHYVQASVQFSIYAYWGWYWRNVYEAVPLLLAQFAFLYAFDGLLTWTRGRDWKLGCGPIPIVLSTNLFLWFRNDWFLLQFVMLAVAALGKEFLRWQRDGRSTHIFNPSAFGLSVAAAFLIAFDATHLTWGIEVATTIGRPPHIFLEVFLLGLIVQSFFSVTLMTVSAIVSLCLFAWLYQLATGVYFFVDTNIPIAIFLGMHLLVTDPATSPRTSAGRILFGSAYGLANVALFWWLGRFGIPDFYDKLLPVPLLNLCVPWLDRSARDGWIASVVKRVKLARVLQLNVAHMGVWAALFALMLSTGWVDAPHPGGSIAFWKQAYDEGKPFAGQNLVKLVGNRADSGDAGACNQLGSMYLEGKMTERNVEAAGRYFARAAELGNRRGHENVVEHFFSNGQAASEAALLAALGELERELDPRGDGRGPGLLARAYELGVGRHADPRRAAELYSLASQRGWPGGALGRARLAAVVPLSAPEAAALVAPLEAGCSAGNAESCWWLAGVLRARDGARTDTRRVRELTQRACNGGVALACDSLR
ncbi:MAG: RnfABCDGE type electron transport complex subunit D [Planctomycetota bacterium]|nr:RnfABCDGE type electron transport complex subunit D [Planctomycetota bacterium]